jgi:uncharacterized protein (TIGR00661 family)
LTNSKTILVCPLDWGLGHATRMVPVIDLLLKKKARVIVGADNRPLAYLKSRFPDCEFVIFPGFQPKYPKSGSMAFMMIKSYPEMMKAAKKARLQLQKIITEKNVDIVISDNRYELYSDNAYTVFVTHQLNIRTPGISSVAKPFIQNKINSYIKKYNELWIPDTEGDPNLSGELSHSTKMPIRSTYFIGPLSRFSLTGKSKLKENLDLLIMLSGPEPQRTILENLLVEQALKTNYSTVVLQGKPEGKEETTRENVVLIPHLSDYKIAEYMLAAKHIISRPGYSSLMDLVTLGKKAIFIPTPGQTEQEYLAEKLIKERIFYAERQSDFNLEYALKQKENYAIKIELPETDELDRRIEYLLHSL